jgi:putative transposase
VKDDSLPSVAVDIGVKDIATLSTRKKYPNDHIFVKYGKKLAKLQRRLSRALYGSPEYWKIQTKINHLYGKINNHRKNNIELISSEIAKNFSVIVMEDLSVRALRKISRSRAMTNGYNDASLGLLRRRITDKASSAGHDVILVDPRDTSQLCSSCGMKVPKDLSVRTHVCPYCRYVEDRDVNSCENMLERAGLMGVEWIDPLSVLLSGEQNSRAPGEGCAGTAV